LVWVSSNLAVWNESLMSETFGANNELENAFLTIDLTWNLRQVAKDAIAALDSKVLSLCH